MEEMWIVYLRRCVMVGLRGNLAEWRDAAMDVCVITNINQDMT